MPSDVHTARNNHSTRALRSCLSIVVIVASSMLLGGGVAAAEPGCETGHLHVAQSAPGAPIVASADVQCSEVAVTIGLSLSIKGPGVSATQNYSAKNSASAKGSTSWKCVSGDYTMTVTSTITFPGNPPFVLKLPPKQHHTKITCT